uniref:Secreted protein n=1 Tax=Anopheles quadriannulatus TaxID=34691 RepID=A0A182XPL7_ANOQN
MRPGPGLVVMALAFISGARRGTGQQNSSASQSGRVGIVGEDNTGAGGALTRINPWLSACDLEQPNSAPDLQVSSSSSRTFAFSFDFR